jgi:hypothetical protein
MSPAAHAFSRDSACARSGDLDEVAAHQLPHSRFHMNIHEYQARELFGKFGVAA